MILITLSNPLNSIQLPVDPAVILWFGSHFSKGNVTAGSFYFEEKCDVRLRHKREPINDGRRRCRYCQNIITGHPTKKNCNLCLAWLAFSGWRNAIAKRDNYTCAYCGDKIDTFHVDHVFPRSKGGKNTASNLVTSCASCNLAKSDNPLDPTTTTRVVESIQKRNKKHGIPDDMYFPADYGKRRR